MYQCMAYPSIAGTHYPTLGYGRVTEPGYERGADGSWTTLNVIQHGPTASYCPSGALHTNTIEGVLGDGLLQARLVRDRITHYGDEANTIAARTWPRLVSIWYNHLQELIATGLFFYQGVELEASTGD